MKVIKESSGAVASAAALLKRGGVIICPTDTVYGFLADASNKKAVEKIYKIKNRPKSKPLSIFVKDFKMVKEVAVIDEKQAKILSEFWPGNHTFILKKSPSEAGPRMLYGVKKDSVAIRIPKHAFLQKLLKKVNRPLAQTSANISAQEPLNSVEQIKATFGPAPSRAEGKNRLVSLIIASSKPLGGKPSEIIDLTTKKKVTLRK